MATHRAPKDDKPSLSNGIARYSRYNTFIGHRISNPSFAQIRSASLLVHVLKNLSLTTNKFTRVSFFYFIFLFSSHTLRGLAFAVLLIFI